MKTLIRKLPFACVLSLVSLASCRDGSMFPGAANKETTMDITGEMAPPPPPPMEQKSGISREENIAYDKAEAGNAGLTTSDALNTVTTVVPLLKIAEKIRKTANIDMAVEDYKDARAKIDAIIKSNNAYIGGESEQNSTYSISNNMVIRVANKDFDKVVANLAGVASHVNSKNIYTEDVTAQFIDITARLKTKKEVEKRYMDLLQKATKVGEILEVEEQLRVIREEIEAKEGELKYLNDQVDYSTINLNFHQDFEYTPQDEPGFFGRIGHAFGNGWKGFLGFLIGVVYAWPLWIILGLIAWFTVKFIKKRLGKK